MSDGKLLHQAFRDTFRGGGWADPLEWHDFDKAGQARYADAEQRYLQLQNERGDPDSIRLVLDSLIFALETTDVCLQSWNGGRGGPADVEGILERARKLQAKLTGDA